MKIKLLLRIVLFVSLGALLWTAYQKGNMPTFDKLFPTISNKELQSNENNLSNSFNRESKRFLFPQKFEFLLDYLSQERADKFNVKFFASVLNSQGIEHSFVKKTVREAQNNSFSEINAFSGVSNKYQKTVFQFALFESKTNANSDLLKMIFSIKTTQSANILTNIISKLTSYNWIRNLENKQNIEFKNKHNKKITLSSAQETNSSETQIFVDYQSQNSLPIQFAKLVQDSAGKVK